MHHPVRQRPTFIARSNENNAGDLCQRQPIGARRIRTDVINIDGERAAVGRCHFDLRRHRAGGCRLLHRTRIDEGDARVERVRLRDFPDADHNAVARAGGECPCIHVAIRSDRARMRPAIGERTLRPARGGNQAGGQNHERGRRRAQTKAPAARTRNMGVLRHDEFIGGEVCFHGGGSLRFVVCGLTLGRLSQGSAGSHTSGMGCHRMGGIRLKCSSANRTGFLLPLGQFY